MQSHERLPPDFSILGLHPSEARIYWLLLSAVELTPKEIMDRSDLSKPTVYSALRTLAELDLIDCRGKNPAVYRALFPDKLDDVKRRILKSHDRQLERAIAMAQARFQTRDTISCAQRRPKKIIVSETVYSQPDTALTKLRDGLALTKSRIIVLNADAMLLEELLDLLEVLGNKGVDIELQFSLDAVVPMSLSRLPKVQVLRVPGPRNYRRVNDIDYPLMEVFVDQARIFAITLQENQILHLETLSSPRCISCMLDFRKRVLEPQLALSKKLPTVRSADKLVYLLQSKPMTRSELSKKSGLSGNRVSELLTELIQEGIVSSPEKLIKGALFTLVRTKSRDEDE